MIGHKDSFYNVHPVETSSSIPSLDPTTEPPEVNPPVFAMIPLFGPEAGGTQLDITVKNLDIELIEAVYVGELSDERVCQNLTR